MPESPSVSSSTRRGFLASAVGSAGLGALAATGCQPPTNLPGGESSGAGGGIAGKRLKVLFSNAGLQSTWCTLGRDTALLWGEILGLDVTWIDGEFNAERQREQFDSMLEEPWDYCCVQSVQVDSLSATVSELKKRGVPVVSIDQLITTPEDLRETGVWCHLSADQEFMGETSARYMLEKIGGTGRVIHIGGLSAHSGAQGRMRGFVKALADYPDVEVVSGPRNAEGGVRWCDWDKGKARDAFEVLLDQYADQKIHGAFFHNDDMALACHPALEQREVHQGMELTGVDGQEEGLTGVRDGQLAGTTVNPVCRLHFLALVIGAYIVRHEESIDSVPLEIIVPTTRVSTEDANVDAQFYLADPKHCLF